MPRTSGVFGYVTHPHPEDRTGAEPAKALAAESSLNEAT